ncbi:hypothetical protein DFH28DRAFT_1055735 [Melampsora americana]|nr:hypothetical protein DFH28DRAFT_1055735 [Melampsora americana]
MTSLRSDLMKLIGKLIWVLILIEFDFSFQSIVQIKFKSSSSSSTNHTLTQFNQLLHQLNLNSNHHHTFTVDGQHLFINQNQIHLINHHHPFIHHQLQNCQHLTLFSITPSQLDPSLIFQSDDHSIYQTTNQIKWFKDDLNQFLSQLQPLSQNHPLTPSSDQITFPSSPTLLHQACQSTHLALQLNLTALVFVPPHSLKSFSELLPAHLESFIHLNRTQNKQIKSNQIHHLNTLNEKLSIECSKIKYQSKIDRLINTLNLHEFLIDTKTLTGTHPKSNWITRHSFSEGILLALDWLIYQFNQIGIQCETHHFQSGLAPNLICKISKTSSNPSDSNNERIVISAHYDTRGTFGILSQPGADDNAFGCAVLLSIAKSIKRHQLSIKRDLYLVAFSGTEQGSWGSQALAQKWSLEQVSILLFLNANMIGYRVPGESMQLGLPTENHFTSVPNWYLGNLTNLYLPELYIGTTPVTGLDSQSFGLEGYPATSLFERVGRIANPFYHLSTDQVDQLGYDPLQALTIGKAMYATVLDLVL